MFLILGSAYDPCCSRVHAGLQASGHSARIVDNPLAHPARFTWLLNDTGLITEWVPDQSPAEDIDGVLVRGGGWLESNGWQPQDLAYVQAEMHAALLAWFHGLPCTVINRYSASLWYRPQLPLLAWRPLLATCGLAAPETLLSNAGGEARAFGQRLAADGLGGAIYRPLTSDTHYLVATENDWTGLTAMQARAPVCLTSPHGAPQLACVVDRRVVWNGAPSADAVQLEPALCQFAVRAGLDFVEIAVAPTAGSLRVVAVEHQPHIERFDAAAQRDIAAGLVRHLTSTADATVGGLAVCGGRR